MRKLGIAVRPTTEILKIEEMDPTVSTRRRLTPYLRGMRNKGQKSEGEENLLPRITKLNTRSHQTRIVTGTLEGRAISVTV